MPFLNSNGIRYYKFEIFPDTITQAVFTRQGGVSSAPWTSLNVGGTVGDDIQHVRENRIRSFKALGRVPESIHDVWQVHSADVVYAARPRSLEQVEGHHGAVEAVLVHPAPGVKEHGEPVGRGDGEAGEALGRGPLGTGSGSGGAPSHDERDEKGDEGERRGQPRRPRREPRGQGERQPDDARQIEPEQVVT